VERALENFREAADEIVETGQNHTQPPTQRW
jgi:hypothetical protein